MGQNCAQVSGKGELAVELYDSSAQVEAACKAAECEILLAAPFIKTDALQRLLIASKPLVPLTIVTRWRLEDLASGVLDPEIWPMIVGRGNARILTRRDLHAKYYRADNVCVVGSANITLAALGWSRENNFELSFAVGFTSEIREFEARLLKDTVLMDEERYTRSLEAANVLHECRHLVTSELDVLVAEPEDSWIPSTRDPADLWRFYSGNDQVLTSAAKDCAEDDLRKLGIRVKDLTQDAFAKLVGNQLIESRVLRLVDANLDRPRRFGEMRALIKQFAGKGCDEIDASHVWQTLMRWLLFFRPSGYKIETPGYSEIISKTPYTSHEASRYNVGEK